MNKSTLTTEEKRLRKNERERLRRIKDKEKINAKKREFYSLNREKCLEQKRKSDNKPEIKTNKIRRDKERYKQNREQMIEREKNRRATGIPAARIKERFRNDKEYRKKIYSARNKRLKNDLQFKISNSLRVRLGMALRNKQKTGSAVNDLGCTVGELIIWLENQFLPGMNWDNWSRTGWHIDHIKPLSSFDLTNRTEFLKANHFTNLRPLWAKDNLKKGNKI